MARLADPSGSLIPKGQKKINESGGERGRAIRMRRSRLSSAGRWQGCSRGSPAVRCGRGPIAWRRPPARAPRGRGPAGRGWLLRGRGVLVVAEVEVVEVGVG